MFCEMTKDYEDAVLKEMVKGVMSLAMNKVKRRATLDDFRSLVQYLEKKCHAIGKVWSIESSSICTVHVTTLQMAWFKVSLTRMRVPRPYTV